VVDACIVEDISWLLRMELRSVERVIKGFHCGNEDLSVFSVTVSGRLEELSKFGARIKYRHVKSMLMMIEGHVVSGIDLCFFSKRAKESGFS
jgi:hypothetical protein